MIETGRVAASDPIVRFAGIGKTYDGVNRVVDDLHLDIVRGEFLTLLGPSGSGKTTTLMMLAGFETPTFGEITFEGKPLSRLPPYQRQIGMVFQNYALFPHMSVADNIGFPLSVRRVPRDETARRVERALEMVRLAGFGGRRPAQLSGGQQQRVAVARALVFEPKLVLMDEPLGALDKQLREQMQLEIRRLHAALGVTMVYVTHDQGEALTMSDRIAVFHRGKIQQLDRPEQLYERPINAFVARFIGENNRFDGTLQAVDGERCSIRIAGDVAIQGSLASPLAAGTAATVSLRPERVQIGAPGATIAATAGCSLRGTLREVIYLGDHVRARVALPGNDDFTVKRPIDEVGRLPAIGGAVELSWMPEHCRAFAREDTAV
ncbi:MAG TPA: ABC transporter ATP-binding protein [Casimicrobiaceae bacterium]|nr:ABC transporter ATP-binding protein [Casimicrobiaceae bacterium]